MPEMTLKDLDEFSAPRRRPWVILMLLACLVAAGIHHYFSRSKKDDPRAEGAAEVDVSAPDALVIAPGPAVWAEPAGALNMSMAEGAELEKDGELVLARNLYLSLLKATSNATARATIEKRLGNVNVELVTSPMLMPEKVEYVVVRGDRAEKIARKFGTTVELLQIGNGLKNPNLIRLGDRWRVFTGKFSIVASRSECKLHVYMNDEFFKTYSVGIGKYGKTPVGTFTITERIPEPVWWRSDGKEVPYGSPENILGTHWMTLRATGDTADVRGYGIHGTWDDPSIGKAESAGCLRMHNKDVKELYTMLPTGTPVTILE